MAGKSTPETQQVDLTDDLLNQADGMFGDQGAGATDDMFGDADDLLNQVEEDDSEGWNPSEKGEGVAGVIVKIGETKSDFAKGDEDPMKPTVTIQNRDGKFRIIGFSSVLERELRDGLANGTVKIGNLMAVKYWGERPIKRGPFAGKNYRHFSVVAQAPRVTKP